jgi:hypothetical protein
MVLIKNNLLLMQEKLMQHLPEAWLGNDGKVVSCEEKIKLLNENLLEIATLCQDALDDAVLMGCDEAFVRHTLKNMIHLLDKPYS